MILLESIMDIQQPTLMAEIIDKGVANRDMAYVLATGMRMIIYALLGLLGGAACSISSTCATTVFAGEIRKGLFEKIQSLSLAQIDRLTTGSLITRITNDVAQVQHMAQQMLRIAIRSPMLCFGSLVMAFLLSPRLGLVLLIAIPIEIVAVVIIVRRATPRFSLVQRCMDKVNRVMRENLLGIRVVKAFAVEDRQFKQFSEANEGLADTSIYANGATILMNPIVALVMNLATVAALWAGGWMQIAGMLKTGIIMAFVNYMVQIANSTRMLVMMVVNFSRASASVKRINEVLDLQPGMENLNQAISTTTGGGACARLGPVHPSDGHPPNGHTHPPIGLEAPDIIFKGVSFHYSTSKVNALTDINCVLKGGEKVGIIGATGSGKTTLVNLISRLYDVTEGCIKLAWGDSPALDIRSIDMDELRKTIAVVPQDSLLFYGSVADNLRQGDDKADDETLWEALETAQAADFIQALPEGLLTIVDQRGRNFSGGQKQRLTVARAILRRAPILILDDASSALDLETDAKLREAIRRRQKGISLIIVAQRVASLMDCDRILLLDHGRLIGQGNHRELLETNEIYRSIAVSQLGDEVLEAKNG
jgi:ATP-binding cassette subfamily B protein